jgi:hypothetical protein
MLRRSLALALAACSLLPASAGAWTRLQAPTDDSLWATVNQCDPKGKPGAVGIRVAIPDGVGRPEQWARIRLQWFDGAARAWRGLASADAGWERIGVGARPVEGGTTFSFKPPAAGSRLVLRGVVDVEWRKGADVVDSAHLLTTAGHEDSGDRHLALSQTSCQIAR